MADRKTQAQRVYEYMEQFGSITPLDGFRDLGVTRLAARIFELRQAGKEIESETMTEKNRFGIDCRFAKYYIPKKKGQLGLF